MKKSKRKKPVTISTNEALSKIDRMMPILYNNIYNAIRIEATLEAGNDLVGSLKDKSISGAEAYNTIKNSLSFDLAMHLSRLFDVGVRRKHPNKRDVASIPLMARLLRQKRCQKALCKRAVNWTPFKLGMERQYEADCMNSIERALREYKSIFNGSAGRRGLRTLKAFRDYHMAHSIMTDDKSNPIYNDLFQMTDCAREFVAAAKLALEGVNVSLADHEVVYRNVAKIFWEKALCTSQ